jgi:uncharacterized protein YkwD
MTRRLLLLAAAAAALAISGCGQAQKKEADINLLLELHNEQRGQRKMKPLELDPYLVEYAKNHAAWMARKNSMRHSDIGDLVGRYRTAGENIAWNQKDEKQVTVAWMNSRPHRANILNKNFSKVGFGMVLNSRGQPYWCTVFGD